MVDRGVFRVPGLLLSYCYVVARHLEWLQGVAMQLLRYPGW